LDQTGLAVLRQHQIHSAVGSSQTIFHDTVTLSPKGLSHNISNSRQDIVRIDSKPDWQSIDQPPAFDGAKKGDSGGNEEKRREQTRIGVKTPRDAGTKVFEKISPYCTIMHLDKVVR